MAVAVDSWNAHQTKITMVAIQSNVFRTADDTRRNDTEKKYKSRVREYSLWLAKTGDATNLNRHFDSDGSMPQEVHEALMAKAEKAFFETRPHSRCLKNLSFLEHTADRLCIEVPVLSAIRIGAT